MPGNPRMRRRCACLLIVLAVLIGVGACTAKQSQPKVVAFGDSLLFETQTRLRADLVGRGVRDLTVRSYGGTAISDWLDDMRLAALHSDRHTLFVVEFGSNYFTDGVAPTVGYAQTDEQVLRTGYSALVQKYADDAARAERILTQKGARVLWIGGPAMPTRPWLLDVNERFRALATAHPGTSAYAEAGLAVAPNRTFSATLPCRRGEQDCRNGRVTVRSADRIHLCPGFGTALRGVVGSCKVYSGGEVRFSGAIADAVARLVVR